MDKKIAADKIRAKLEKRVATLLGCDDASNLPAMRLGVLVNLLFCMEGNGHEVGSYFATCEGLTKIVGREVMWDDPAVTAEDVEPPKAVVN